MILYLHGFNSSPTSYKARTMQKYLAERGLDGLFNCPLLPHRPCEAIALAESFLQGHDPGEVTLVGSSLGGFYATWLAEKHACRAILIQPAVFPYVGLEPYLGKQENLYTRVEYELTKAHLDEWQGLCVDTVDSERYLLLLETGDEVLDYREAVQKYEGARMVIRQGGDHMLQSFPEHLPRMLEFARLTS